MNEKQLKRIADILIEEILRLVKKDMENMQRGGKMKIEYKNLKKKTEVRNAAGHAKCLASSSSLLNKAQGLKRLL